MEILLHILTYVEIEIYRLLAGLPFSNVDGARIGGHIAAGIGVAAIAAGVAVASVAAIATISTAVAKGVSPAVTSVASAVTAVAVASVIGVSYGQRQKAEQDLKNRKKVIYGSSLAALTSRQPFFYLQKFVRYKMNLCAVSKFCEKKSFHTYTYIHIWNTQ